MIAEKPGLTILWEIYFVLTVPQKLLENQSLVIGADTHLVSAENEL